MLLERDEPLAALGSAFARAREGRGGNVFIGGEAGIGKTALLEAFAGTLDSSSARVLWGACEALSTPRPLGPLIDIAEQAGGELRDALHANRAPHELFQSFLNCLREGDRPWLVVVEDAHWADDASADFLKFVARRIARLPALVVVTYREEEVSSAHPLMRAVADVPADHVKRLRLAGLSREAVSALARAHKRDIGDLYAIADGNPLLVTELLRNEGTELPLTLRDSLLPRLHRLSPKARELAEWVAVVPDRTERWLLERAWPVGIQQALQECLDHRLLVVSRLDVRYRHELARRVVEESLPDLRRRDLNAAVLGLLESEPPASGMLPRLVHHADTAGDAAAVLRHAPSAGDEAVLRGAHRQAAAFYRTALRYADHLSPQERAILLEKLAWEALSCGAQLEARDANERAFESWQIAGDTFAQGRNRRIRFDFEDLMTATSRRGSQADASDRAVALLEPHGASSELAMAYASKAYALCLRGRHQEAERCGALAIDMAQALNEPRALIQVLLHFARRRNSFFGAPDFESIERALQLALRLGVDALTAHAYVNMCIFRNMAGYYDGLDQLIQETLAFVEQRDMDAHASLIRAIAARYELARGNWDRAGELARGVLTHSQLPGFAEFSANVALGAVRVRRSEPGGIALLERAREIAQTRIAVPTIHLAWINLLAEANWLVGNHVKALELAAQGRSCLRAIFADARSLGISTRWSPGPPWAGSCWLWRELPGQVAGEFDGVVGLLIDGHWQSAATLWAERGLPYERALALIHGDSAAQHEALAILDRLGAKASLARCRQMLAERGVQRIPRGPRASTRANPVGLTNREMQVLVLLDQGLANHEISHRLSRSAKTIEHHVAAVLAKLGAATRKEAPRIARERGLLPTVPDQRIRGIER
jgi:DNA-binding CsgD family transcriptional regulator/tetratricopeptide (TPR) repeat protein